MTVRILTGDCLSVMRGWTAECFQTVVTSPPYWGLRDYGVGGQLGLETTPEEYVANMVEVFREVRRVLRDDGTLWLNLGDSYATGAGKVGDHPGGGEQGARWAGETTRHRDARRRPHGQPASNGHGLPQVERVRALRDGSHAGKQTAMAAMGPMIQPNRMPIAGLKPKDLVGIPWRVAFALQADGWWLRQDIIWQKPNPMPESVRDRCTKAHEYIFLLTKSERYYFDAKAIAEPVAGNPAAPRNRWNTKDRVIPGQKPQKRTSRSGNLARKPGSARGCPKGTGSNVFGSIPWEGATRNKRSVWTVTPKPFSEAHFATFPPALIEPCVLAGCSPGGAVLDPFAGAGTTGLVAQRHGRDAVLIELNPEYAAMARARIDREAPRAAA